MIVSIAKIDCSNIKDWGTFHSEFDRVFGFPSFYGRNLDAWIDCMSSLDAPEEQMTSIHCEPGNVLTIELENVKVLKESYPSIYDAIIEFSSFVNWRHLESHKQPLLALSFYL